MELTNAQRNALRDVALRAKEHLESIPQDTDGLVVSVVGGANRDALIPGETENEEDRKSVV